MLSLGTGLLLGLSWVPHLTVLIFIAWVPFFLLEHLVLQSDIRKKRRMLFWLSYLAFLTWNIFDTWWVAYASLGGAALAIACNALFMSGTYYLYLFASSRIKSNYRVLLFIPFWLTFEYLHTDWDLSWTWLTLGNVFAFKTSWIQWYEYTGVSGGSLWILLVNCLGFLSVMEFKNFDALRKGVLIISIIILVYSPTQVSEYVLEHYLAHSPSTQTVKGSTVKTVVVQPGIDPYVEKFEVPFQVQFLQALDLLRGKIDSTTDYIVFPETFVPHIRWKDEIWEDKFGGHPYLTHFYDSLLSKYPQLHIVTGADTHYEYKPGEERSPTARKFDGREGYYESFNSAIQLAIERPVQVYHKSKLVPGVEMVPFPRLLGGLAIQMGGTSGSLGRQQEREVFDGPKGARVGPVICYESVFGEYVAEYVRKGANVLFIVTNDGWWDDTPGYKQHLAYASLRAIETRRYIARSANTGISCVVDDAGEIHHPAKWYEKTVIPYSVPLIEWKTFFVRHGDYIARFMRWIVLAALLAGAYLWRREKLVEKKRALDKEREKERLRMRNVERDRN